jgi:hypothetical protein
MHMHTLVVVCSCTSSALLYDNSCFVTAVISGRTSAAADTCTAVAAYCHNAVQSVNEATTATAAAVAAGTVAAAATASANASSSNTNDGCVPASVKLLANWCANSETDNDVRGRFKLIGDVKNADTVREPAPL